MRRAKPDLALQRSGGTSSQTSNLARNGHGDYSGSDLLPINCIGRRLSGRDVRVRIWFGTRRSAQGGDLLAEFSYLCSKCLTIGEH